MRLGSDCCLFDDTPALEVVAGVVVALESVTRMRGSSAVLLARPFERSRRI